MIKEKTFLVAKIAMEPKKHVKLPAQTNFDCAALNRFIEAIGPEHVVSVAGSGYAQAYTVFYKADDLLTCPECEWDYSPDHAFCGNCGKPLVPISEPEGPACIHCGKPLLPTTSTFCSFCGRNQYKSKFFF